MNEKEIKEILNDPKKLLDLFRLFHQLIHVYEAQERLAKTKAPGEKMGLSDSVEIKLTKSDSNKTQEVK